MIPTSLADNHFNPINFSKLDNSPEGSLTSQNFQDTFTPSQKSEASQGRQSTEEREASDLDEESSDLEKEVLQSKVEHYSKEIDSEKAKFKTL
jgi:hypothetical protein